MSRLIDGFLGIFYRLAASNLLLAAWFRKVDPAKVEKSKWGKGLILNWISQIEIGR